MNLLYRLVSSAAKAFRRFLGEITEAATKGVAPEENIYAVNANVEWGKRWILMAVDTLLSGGRVHVNSMDLAMLLIFIASSIVARRMKATSVTMASVRDATNG